MQTIDNNAFDDCSKLIGTLTIPASVTTIGQEAFMNTKLSNIYFSMTTPAAIIGMNIFGPSFGPSNSTITINVPKGAKVAWDATPNILFKLGITNFSQIVQPKTTPVDIEEIILDKAGPYIFNNTLINTTNVVKASSKILPIDADQTINWSITTNGQKTKPDNISIDAYSQVSIDPTNGMQPTKYDLTIKATCPTNDTITTSKDIIIYIVSMDPITFQTPGSIDVENNITTQTLKNKAISTINPLDANLSIKWIIQNLDGTVAPSWIIIKTDGEIYVNNTNAVTIAKYKFKVIATCNENETINESSDIVVNVFDPTIPDPQSSSDFPVWAYLVIIGATTVIVSSLTITIVTIKRKNKDE